MVFGTGNGRKQGRDVYYLHKESKVEQDRIDTGTHCTARIPVMGCKLSLPALSSWWAAPAPALQQEEGGPGKQYSWDRLRVEGVDPAQYRVAGLQAGQEEVRRPGSVEGQQFQVGRMWARTRSVN